MCGVSRCEGWVQASPSPSTADTPAPAADPNGARRAARADEVALDHPGPSLTFGGNIIETDSDPYRLAHIKARRQVAASV